MSDHLSEEESKALWQKIMSEVGTLPSLPEIVSKLIKELENKDTNPEALEKIIINDSSLSAKVLRIANSAYYGQSRQIDTISKAIVLMGMNTIRNLALTLASSNALNRSFDGYGLEKGQLFTHSLATAVGAGFIARNIKSDDQEKVFLAGLLHDIGKILLSPYLKKYIEVIKKIVFDEDKPFNKAEKEVFGFNHCDLGAELAIRWELPQLIVDSNKYHHDPSECKNENSKIIEYVHIADHISYLSKFGLGIDGNNYKILFETFEKYKIDDERKAKLIENVTKDTNELFKSMVVV
ncbi:MAG: HDOD domain-containing protein [Spirochaetes bacterium]|nr:HDOD domain-containing protein [Spirochaetota bacterium]